MCYPKDLTCLNQQIISTDKPKSLALKPKAESPPMSVNFLATSVPFEPDDFAVIFGIYPIDRTSVGVLHKSIAPFNIIKDMFR